MYTTLLCYINHLAKTPPLVLFHDYGALSFVGLGSLEQRLQPLQSLYIRSKGLCMSSHSANGP